LCDKRIAFLLPEGGTQIELRCRRFIPARVNPASTDQRALGICMARWQIDGVDVALTDDAALSAWHALESDADGRRWRWSQDRVPLPPRTRLIVLDLAFPGLYWTKLGDQHDTRVLGSGMG
jgi:hypothetical protein